MKRQFLLVFVALLLATLSSWATVRNVPSSYATIQAAIDASDPGDIIQVETGILTVASQVNVNKANLTIQGVSNTLSKIQVSGTGERFLITGSGVTIQNLEIVKTDKVGVQNIIGIQASNVTIKNNIFHGQFAITPAAFDGDVSRALVISGGYSGLLIDNNQFYNLRQPAYVSGVTTGTVSNNFTYNTKGWVLEGGNLTFTGNTWGTGLQANVFDIAILNQSQNVGYYLDIVAMSNANNDAVIEDQRVSPAVLSVVYVDETTSFTTDLGGRYHPYSSMTPAIARKVAGGKIINIVYSPITTIGTPTPSACGTFDVPVTVKNFNNVGNISMVLNFDAAVLAYQTTGVTLNPAISGADYNVTTPGKFVLGWNSLAGITLADDAVLFTLHYNLPTATLGGSTTNFTWSTVPQDCEYSSPGYPAIVYPSTFNNQTLAIPARPVVNTNTGLQYCTIQAAIDDALTLNGHIITVAAGTYAEVINVNKRVDLRGPNYGIDGNSGSRVAEAIIVPPTELNASGQREWSENPLVKLSVNGVKIDGFRISGDNPLINGYSYAGMNIEAGLGILSTGNSIEFKNNVVDQFTYIGFHTAGDQVAPHYKDLVIEHNKFDKINDLNQLGYGFAMYIQGSTAAVTNNTVTNSRTAIQVQPYDVIQSGSTAPVVSNNNFSVWRNAIYYNYAELNASAWTVSLNNITACTPPANPSGRVLWSGIAVETMRATSNGGIFLSNTIDGTGAVIDASKWWGVWGMLYKGDASTSTNVFFTNNTVSNVETGFAFSAPADIVLTGNNLSASGQAISVQHNYSSAGVDQGTGGANNINALGGNTINGIATSGASLADLFTVEDAITHKIDESWRGLVSVKANELFVTPISFAGLNTTPKIQRGVDAATAGFIVNVKAGTYVENVNVNKSISLLGPNTDVDPTTASPSRVAEAIVVPAVGDAVNGRVFDITADNVTINGFTVDGDNPGISGGVSSNGADINTQFGIGSGTWSSGSGGKSGMIVKYNIVKNVNDGGIYGNAGASTVTGGLFTYNRIDNSPWWGIVMENNCYTDITHNRITRVSRGIQYDNYHLAKPTSGNMVVEYNDITYTKRGILQNLFYQSASLIEIKNNTLTAAVSPEAANVGLLYWSIQTGVTAKASNNTVYAGEQGVRLWNIQGNVTVDANTINGGQYGIVATTLDAYGLGSTLGASIINNTVVSPSLASLYLEDTDAGVNSIALTATNNFFNGGADGVRLSGAELSATVNSNSITGQSSKGVNATAYTGTSSFDFNCNWWGTANASAVNAIDPPIDYSPWLTNGTDFTPAIAGFQPVAGSCGGTPVVIASATTDDIICGETTGSIAVTFSGGTAPYSIVWTGGLAATIVSPYTITGLPAGVCSFTITDANGTTATSSATVLYLPVTNTSTTTYYPTIQAAIDAATAGNVISVCAGTYAEDLTVTKKLTILGPNATINPNTGVRVAEAILVPATSDPNPTSAGSKPIMYLNLPASGTTIDGFTFDGDNTLLTSSVSINGANIDAIEGISSYEGVGNITITNNIVKNLSYAGMDLYNYNNGGAATSGNKITNNKIDNIIPTSYGLGILIYNNFYADVTGNVMTRVRVGIQTGNYSQANTGTTQSITGNSIQASKTGIFHNLAYSSASPFVLSGNTITALNFGTETKWCGILLSSLSVPSTSQNNIINASAVTIPSTGYEVWNVKSNAPASIIGGSVTGVDFGVFANNFEGYSSNAGDGAYANVSGLTITTKSAGIGVRVFDSPSSTTHAAVRVSLSNCNISGGLEGVKFQETQAGTVGGTVNGNTISASAIGIDVTSAVTSSTNPLSITNNQISLTSQLAGSTPTTAILLSKVTGTAAATISSNTISGSYYGYMVYNLNTLPKTTITGGTITGVMQGVSVLNIDPVTLVAFAPSTLDVSDIAMSGFAGNYPSLPNSNFHAGVYVFTGGAVDAASITATVDKISVTGTGKIQGDCAGLSFADFSSNAVNMQNVTVTECTLTNNLNRGINIRGKNALVNIGTSTLTGNGSDPYGMGGNDGFGIIVRQGAVANVNNCFITNPASVAGGYNVSALCTDPGDGATNATINATENSLSQNGNTTSWLANNSNGTLNTSCNWWGTALTSGIASKINGTVTYPTWLVIGTDASADAGFQPVAGACKGSPVVFNCGTDVTIEACSTQAVVNAAYAAFISSTTASGCAGVLTNNAPTAAPSFCDGGSFDVTWTYTSDCETVTCTRTFKVKGEPNISLNVPAAALEVSCQTQSAIDAAFSAWVNTATASGGCNGVFTKNSNNATAPAATGGSVTVTFTYTTCSGSVSDNAIFSVAYPKTISGTLKYNNAAKTPMNLVTLTLSGAASKTTVTDANGFYSFTDLCDGTYTITVTDNKKDVGSINSTDAGAANAWGVSGGTIEYTQFLAGDVTNDIYINSTDAQRIQKYFVNGLPFTRAAWSYWKKGVTIANTDMTPKPANFNVIIGGADVVNFDLLGMCTGDFNGSLVPTSLKSAHSSLTLANKDQFNAVSGQEFELPIRAASAMQVGAVSMILDIPSNLVSIQNIKVNGSTDPVSWAVNGNELRIGWYSSTPVNVAENGNLLTLKLKTSNSFTVGSAMEFALQFNPLNELADGNFEVIKGANLLVAQVTNGNGITGLIDPTENSGLSFNNYPNPFRSSTTVDYKLPVSGKVTIDVYNQIGQLVQSLVNANQNAGNYSIRMDANSLMPGIYIAKLRLTNTDVDMTGTVKLSVLK